MLIDIIFILVGIVGLLVATYTDIKTREVPDWLNYSLISVGFGIRLIYSLIYNQWIYFGYGLIGAGAMFLLGSFLYYTKQWGGGDTKLLVALGILFATEPSYLNGNLNPFFLGSLLINILIAGAIWALLYSFYLALKNRKKLIKEIKEIMSDKKIKFIRLVSFFISFLLFVLIFLTDNYETKLIFLGFLIFLLAYVYFWIFVKGIENVCMFKKINVDSLVEGDWICEDVYSGKKLIYNKNKLGVEESDIWRLKKNRVKTVVVKEGIPFVPSFLIGLLMSLIGFSLVRLLF